MRYAIFGDIHGNSEALAAVFADIEKECVDRYVCLGDIVGYGAEPRECLREIRSRGIDTVLGNHDSAAVGDTPLDYFNPYARVAVEWTAKKLSEDEEEWISGLPLVRNYDGFTVVHATLSNPKEWDYILGLDSARKCFELLATQVCFVGHSHVPVVFMSDGSITFSRESETVLEKGCRYIVNAGSVGQPRDGDARASYAILDWKAGRVEIRRVPYDYESTQEKILKAGLPPSLALRLGLGR